MPLPMVRLTISAARLHRPTARTTCVPADFDTSVSHLAWKSVTNCAPVRQGSPQLTHTQGSDGTLML